MVVMVWMVVVVVEVLCVVELMMLVVVGVVMVAVEVVVDGCGVIDGGWSSDGGGRAITTSEQTAQARNNYSRGNPGQSASIDELFNYQNTSLTNDFGYNGNGVQALA